jgi:hypothetical protein
MAARATCCGRVSAGSDSMAGSVGRVSREPCGCPPDGAAQVCLKAGIDGIEQLTPGNDHDVHPLPPRQRWRPPEYLANQPLRSIAAHRVAQLAGSDDAEARLTALAGRHEHREVPPLNPGGVLENVRELAPPADPAGLRKPG